MGERAPGRAEESFNRFKTESAKLLSDLQSTTSNDQLSLLKSSLDEARRQVSEGVEWWPPYDVRTANATIVSLEQAFDGSKQRIQPRRKFRFGKKKADIGSDGQGSVDAKPSREGHTSVKKEASSSKTAPGTNNNTSSICLSASDVQNGVLTLVDTAGKDITISNIEKARIELRNIGALRVLELKDCQVDVEKIDGSFYVSSCTGCTFKSTSRQLRIHGTTRCKFTIDVRGDPIIENCSDVAFGQLGDAEGNKWDQVKDFSWLREERSPNWKLIED